ncbi:hypothetical protein [Amedibacillus sp. YH-ame10]
MMRVDTEKLFVLQTEFSKCLSISKELQSLQYQLSLQQTPLASSIYLQELKTSEYQLHEKIIHSVQYFQSALSSFQQSENNIQKTADAISSFEKSKAYESSQNTQHRKSSDFTYKTEVMKFNHRVHSTLNKGGNLVGYVKNGVCIGAFAGFDVWRFRADKEMKYLKTGVDLRVGNMSVSADAKALLFQNGKLDPSLQLEANASATLAQAGAYLNIGNDYLNVQGEANVKVGTASAEAKAVIKKDEFTLKANVGAAAVKGEVKAVFSIFGVKITLKGTGELGAAGAGAEFSSKKGEFEFGGKVSMVAGLGFKVHVDY